MQGKGPISPQLHRWLAIQLNQLTWSLLSKESRTLEEVDTMLEAAHASACHWRQVVEENVPTRGHWLVSRVCAVLDRPREALHYARRCLGALSQSPHKEFDVAYAHEAMARALAACGQRNPSLKYQRLAWQAGGAIQDPEDRKLFLRDFATEPWFELTPATGDERAHGERC